MVLYKSQALPPTSLPPRSLASEGQVDQRLPGFGLW